MSATGRLLIAPLTCPYRLASQVFRLGIARTVHGLVAALRGDHLTVRKGPAPVTLVTHPTTGPDTTTFRALANWAPALIVFTHLRWGGVFQRPQHLLSRFARALPVTVVEEPVFRPGIPDAGEVTVSRDGDVTVLTPVFRERPDQPFGFTPDNVVEIARLIGPHLGTAGTVGVTAGERSSAGVTSRAAGPIVWYYTPMALGALPTAIAPSLVIFDAMDDLASFRGAPPALREREAAMFAAADLVFTGGPSLFAARRDRHRSVHCFPSGVDASHFGRAAGDIEPPAELASLVGPVLGFYGVLDERIDFELIAAVADARCDWQLALVGPLAKISEADLPRRPNITYFGQRRYADLPAFLAGFDVALLPFALNEATRSISPTKTLEYLAGEKPVVSTPIADVVSLYGDVVRIAADAPDFIAAIDAALDEPPPERARRRAAGQAHLVAHDWDAIAAGMASLITGAMTISEDATF